MDERPLSTAPFVLMGTPAASEHCTFKYVAFWFRYSQCESFNSVVIISGGASPAFRTTRGSGSRSDSIGPFIAVGSRIGRASAAASTEETAHARKPGTEEPRRRSTARRAGRRRKPMPGLSRHRPGGGAALHHLRRHWTCAAGHRRRLEVSRPSAVAASNVRRRNHHATMPAMTNCARAKRSLARALAFRRLRGG